VTVRPSGPIHVAIMIQSTWAVFSQSSPTLYKMDTKNLQN